MPGALQVHTAENAFLIHHANAFEEGDETIVLSSGWVRPSWRLGCPVIQCRHMHATTLGDYGARVLLWVHFHGFIQALVESLVYAFCELACCPCMCAYDCACMPWLDMRLR